VSEDTPSKAIARTSGNLEPTAPALSPELFEKFLSQQGQEIVFRKEKLELEKQQDKHSYEFAQKSLSAQVDDREKERIASRTGRRDRMAFAGLVLLLFFGFLFYTLYLGKDDFAKEVLKALAFLSAGALGGYATGRRATDPPEELSGDLDE
jgi:CRISPR/Cas system CSM-associated protein Csm4 (group 5 of RAMP superfamily)